MVHIRFPRASLMLTAMGSLASLAPCGSLCLLFSSSCFPLLQRAPTRIHMATQVPTGTHKYPQDPTEPNRYPQVPTGTHRYSQISTGTYRYPQVSTGTHRYPQALTQLPFPRRGTAVYAPLLHNSDLWPLGKYYTGHPPHPFRQAKPLRRSRLAQ